MTSIAAHSVVLADAATRSAQYAGEFDTAMMPRLAALIAQSADDAVGNVQADTVAQGTADITFSEHRKPRFVGIAGSLDFACDLVCQRCLELAPVTVHCELKLAVCESQAEDDHLAAVAERFERWDHDAEALLLAELFEELILLELPLVVMHEDVERCGALAEDERFAARPVTKQTPFAGLAAMLGENNEQ
ncbi:MAG: YceD family protein [Pseudomonadota bacterium]